MSITDLYNYKDAYKINKLINNVDHPNIILYGNNYITNEVIDLSTITSIPTIDITNTDLNIFKVPILELCGYKMPHPLKEELEFKIKLRDDLSDELIEKIYQAYSLQLVKLFTITQSEQDKRITIIDKRKIIVIYSFINSILTIIQILQSLLDQWTSETTRVNHSITSPSFNIEDPQDYFKIDPKITVVPTVDIESTEGSE